MRATIKAVRKLERHRKVQLSVTFGTMAAIIGSYWWPGWQELVTGINLMTTIIWVWAE
jgi:ABC-type transport system involved in multi-copper enzyme maturation permease subunit